MPPTAYVNAPFVGRIPVEVQSTRWDGLYWQATVKSISKQWPHPFRDAKRHWEESDTEECVLDEIELETK